MSGIIFKRHEPACKCNLLSVFTIIGTLHHLPFRIVQYKRSFLERQDVKPQADFNLAF